ncbi:hypothetical protein QE417_000281 [Mucilaginibacter terrae]|uniref:Uncharacterized protein n=1 Tax=Mucilaginibacter terrae TaxID=1955052 RepID=A0ABU3GN49_9SPHI|nr:hypothetical protein [Mucilaginibacter terrae]MDT3401209.1 hypothetical protein [Mucilaginibacter terrae]
MGIARIIDLRAVGAVYTYFSADPFAGSNVKRIPIRLESEAIKSVSYE